MNFRLALRIFFVALTVGATTGLLTWMILTHDMETALRLSMMPAYLAPALVGSFVIGLPIAIVVYLTGKADPKWTFWRYWVVGNCIASVITLFLGANLGLFGLIFFGIPIFFAANTFAILGWHFVVKFSRLKFEGTP